MQTVMIGDTPMDAIMGRNAHVMLNIGVSGIVPQEVLASMNDVVIASLDEIK
jgi:phosphoglycolate phosphatase-like HAD superfamily hydrolase